MSLKTAQTHGLWLVIILLIVVIRLAPSSLSHRALGLPLARQISQRSGGAAMVMLISGLVAG